jgi:hypothetical protein
VVVRAGIQPTSHFSPHALASRNAATLPTGYRPHIGQLEAFCGNIGAVRAALRIKRRSTRPTPVQFAAKSVKGRGSFLR